MVKMWKERGRGESELKKWVELRGRDMGDGKLKQREKEDIKNKMI